MKTFQDPKVSGLIYARLIVVTLDGLREPQDFQDPRLFIEGELISSVGLSVYGRVVLMAIPLDTPFFGTEDRDEALQHFRRKREIIFRLAWRTASSQERSLEFVLEPEAVQAEEDPWLFRRSSPPEG